MEFFDFFKPEELEDLPEDNQAAFIQLVRIAQTRLKDQLRDLGPRDQDNWEEHDNAQYGFQNVVLAMARKFEIEPFASLQMPSIQDHDQKGYRQFRHDLTHYIAQIMLTLADRERVNSVPLRDEVRQSIQTYIYHLREAILRANLPERKKEDLLKKLAELEEEIGRRRIRVAVVAGIIMAILSAPGELVGSYDAVVRITNSILREIGQAKEADQEQRHISFEQPVALIPPRRTSEKKDELDEEIPF
jgi:hypothetical protein